MGRNVFGVTGELTGRIKKLFIKECVITNKKGDKRLEECTEQVEADRRVPCFQYAYGEKGMSGRKSRGCNPRDGLREQS